MFIIIIIHLILSVFIQWRRSYTGQPLKDSELAGGFKMGPFTLMDLIGIDVNLAVTQSMYEQTFGEPRYKPHVIQQTMVNAGKLGKKTKQGFYKHEK